MRRLIAVLAGTLAIAVGASAAPDSADAKTSKLEIGVGRADVTPPTGYFSFGYVRGDGLIEGAFSRLWAKAIVIRQGDEKLALVTHDLGGIPGGMLKHALERVADRGFDETNVIDSASHTHGGPAGYFNFGTYNTVFMTINSPTDFSLGGGFDPQLYSFMTRQLAKALRRADRDLGPGRLGWGKSELIGPTVNRSLEAHLHNHGIEREYGEGHVHEDPDGAEHTVEERVDVLRVEKRRRGRWLPVGMWSTFANHGTVVKYQFRYYNRDHHGAATEVTERKLRRRGKVPFGQRVVSLYGNTNEGDMSAGLRYDGPAGADEVGRIEARAFMRAWRKAGRKLERRVELDRRWTRMCFCGQQTSAGPIDENAEHGLAQLTGSDEARGPLFDITRTPFEGRRDPAGEGPQGHKLITQLPLDVPTAIPLSIFRIGDRAVFAVPGEVSKEEGVRMRERVMAEQRETGVRRAVLSGVANEFISYLVTPEEYDRQHYEGASTWFGTNTSVAVEDVLADLSSRLADGRPSPTPVEFDPTNGISDDGDPFPDGAETASVIEQPPARAERLGDPSFRWQGGEKGYDRPLERAFIRVQRKQRHGKREWKTIDKDLGLRILWFVDDEGRYTARWEPALDAPLGTYRFLIQGRRYRLVSDTFELEPARSLVPRERQTGPDAVSIGLRYPEAHSEEEVEDPPPDDEADLGYRPDLVRGGRVTFTLDDGTTRTIRQRRGGHFTLGGLASGSEVTIEAGAARDRHGNGNGEPLTLRVP